ncbi:MAG: DegV family protein [Chloroflexi bacterium]|nr:DegV family protein [Chloroflexota bacterium]
MDRSRVAVVTDSTISLPDDVRGQLHIYSVPHELLVNGRTYRDGVDISSTEFYRLLTESPQPPKTSAPPPASFLEVFVKASLHTKMVLCLCLASRLSSTYYSACTAADLARERVPGVELRVVDTGTAGTALGLVALECARAAERGAGLDELAQLASRLADRVYFVAFLETLYYVWRGGRIPKVALWAGNLLNVKPLLELRGGEVRMVERPRSRARARERLLAYLERHGGAGPLHVAVMHAHAMEEANELVEEIRGRFNCTELFLSEFTPVMGAHTGPGLLGLAFLSEA